MKKSLLLLLLLSAQILVAQNAVQTAVNSFINYDNFKNASISICVKDLSSGETIAEHQKLLALPPASTVKLFSTASAFEILGYDYRPTTSFYTDGQVAQNGVISGNLYIKGGGDPSLGSKYFNADGKQNIFLREWVHELIRLGVRKIDGKIIVDGSSFGYEGCPEGWTWGDMGNYYGAGPSGIVLRDNMLIYYFKTAEVGSLSTLLRTEPEIDGLHFMNNVKAAKQSGDESYIFGAPFSYERFAVGTLPYGRREFIVKGSLPDPEYQLAKEFYEMVVSQHIEVEGFDYARNYLIQNIALPNYKKLTLLKKWEGKTIEEITHHTNMKSVNLFAEQLVCLIGHEKTGVGTTEKGLKEMTKYWSNKFDISGLNLKDGSGLSRSNSVSSKNFCDLLFEMSKSPKYSIFKTSLPTAGQTGTLINVCKGQNGEGRVFAKSGTMSRIKSYAGYVKSRSGKDLAFAIIVNNYNCSNATTVDKIETIMNEMAIY
jgi:D-alanyl-D-alanine carboxypeptidase/D-alanyl-D-alanine-endopeptidase (penicillin-binding protein 4)|tara:strand:- start:3068 stop:4522 length:1455 start_codon:yes stop_codon:yes gene_type:complete